MSIQFREEGVPSRKALLDQAAGVGLVFPEDSLEEIYFLDFCRHLWLHGHRNGVEAMREAIQDRIEGISQAS